MKTTQQKQSLVKQDGNFLEYPTYTLTTKTSVKEIVIEKENGKFRLATLNPKLPDRLDKTLLYYIVKRIWENNFKSREVKITRYRIAKDVIGGTGKNDYKRVMDGLKRWENMSVEFEGIFYEGDNYTTRFFGFLDDVIMDHKTKELTIRANEQYLEWLQATKYYRLIDWKKFRSFNRDVSAKLYEFFQLHSFPWKIETSNLVEKLTLSELDKFPSQTIKKIIPAINEINEKTNLNIKFTHYKNNEGKTIFVFESQAKKITSARKRQMKLQLPSPTKKLHEDAIDAIIEEPSDERIDILVARSITTTTARELVEKYPDRIEKQVEVFDYLMAENDPKVTKNPPGYLRKSIEDNYIPPKNHISKEQRQKIEGQQEKEKWEYEKQRRYNEAIRELNENVRTFLNALSPEERTALEQKILETMPKERQTFKPYVNSILFDVIKEKHFKKDLERLAQFQMKIGKE